MAGSKKSLRWLRLGLREEATGFMMTMTENSTGKELLLSRFEEFKNEGAQQNGRKWLLPLRKRAISRFDELGFPTPRQEEWKHTSLAQLAQIEFQPARSAAPVGGVEDLLEKHSLRRSGALEMVFVNGQYQHPLSSVKGLPEGVKLLNLARAIEQERSLVEACLGSCARLENHPFAALNTAFLKDGAFLWIGNGVKIGAPLHFLFLTTHSDRPTLSHPRNLVVAESGSEALFVETYCGPDESFYWTNAVTEVIVRENATLAHYRIQQEGDQAFHLAGLHIHQEAHSQFATQVISLGADLTRNDVVSVLDGEGITSRLDGLFLTHGKQHVDNHTCQEHRKAHCASRELFKGILDDESSGAFTGRIVVQPGAQKTDAIQASRNLLLSDAATINPDPQLEIYADDVRCTHGATVGQLDTEALFYLRSRGLDESQARGILTCAFAGELIGQIQIDALRERLDRLVRERFGRSHTTGRASHAGD
jgi:Fe-S cluster assembly protein SufD